MEPYSVADLARGAESRPRFLHGRPICEFGWHALTIGKGVGIAINSENHALPDGQGRATHDNKLNSNRTSSQPWARIHCPLTSRLSCLNSDEPAAAQHSNITDSVVVM